MPSLPPDSIPLQASHPLRKDMVPLVEKHCWQAEHPQFLARVRWDNKEALVEGVWKEHFHKLQGRVLSPLGDTIQTFSTTEKKQKSLSKQTPLWELLGPQNIRFLLCGAVGFLPQKNEANQNHSEDILYFSLPPSTDTFFSLQNLQWANHSIPTQSKIFVQNKLQNQWDFQSYSNLFYRSKTPRAHLQYQATLTNQRLQPRYLEIQTEKSIYRFDFLDYE